jgi:hypothetical protein
MEVACDGKTMACLLALSQKYPEFVQGLPAICDLGPGETPVCGKTSTIKGTITLVQGSGSADTNYYGIVWVQNGLLGHVYQSTSFSSASPPVLSGQQMTNDPIYAALGADVDYCQQQSACIDVYNTTAVQSLGGSIIAGNTKQGSIPSAATFAALLALDNTVQDSFSAGGRYCMRWDPRRAEDFTPQAYNAGGVTNSTSLFIAFRSTNPQTIDFRVTTNWGLAPIDTLYNVLGAKRQAIDTDEIADMTQKLSPERIVALEAGESTDGSHANDFLKDVVSMGKGVASAVTEFLGEDLVGAVGDFLGGLFAKRNNARLLRQISCLAETPEQFDELDWMPSDLVAALKTLTQYQYYLPPGDAQAIIRCKTTGRRWEKKKLTTTDPFDGEESHYSCYFHEGTLLADPNGIDSKDDDTVLVPATTFGGFTVTGTLPNAPVLSVHAPVQRRPSSTLPSMASRIN